MSKRIPVPARVPAPSDQLAELIRTCGMTPAELAQAASVSPSVLSRFLSGQRTLSLATVDRLADVLGLRFASATKKSRRPAAVAE
jgi:plasmid maintenance system antidote protein VapI